jgi:beta-alanine--pyruvate transaminase
MTNGAVPMGGVLVHHHVHDTMSQGPEAAVEFAHGYTYSGHPLACAAALATLDVYQEESIFEKVARIAGKWEAAIHDIRSAGGAVRDIRNLGLLGAVEIEAAPNAPGQRARAVASHCFEAGVFVRALGDTLILSPPLIINEEQIGQIADGIKNGIRRL